MPELGLLLVAIRVDHPDDIQRRMNAVLALASTYDRPPNTTPVAWCKSQSELVASDLDHLAALVGWEAVRDLNVGDVVAPASTSEGAP